MLLGFKKLGLMLSHYYYSTSLIINSTYLNLILFIKKIIKGVLYTIHKNNIITYVVS